MSIFNVPLGINLTTDNPVKNSPLIYSSYSGVANPPGPAEDLTTESGLFIAQEDGNLLTTE